MQPPAADARIDKVFDPCFEREQAAGRSSLENEVSALFDDLRAPLLRYLLSFGLSPQDGEEVIQEVFLSLFLHLRDDKPRSNIRGWVFRVAHNLGLKRRETNHRLMKLVSHSNEHAVEAQLDAAPGPEERMFALQRRKRLIAILNALPENDRRCLYLRAEGLRYREIAEVLDISVGGVAYSLARSLARLSSIEG